MNLKKTSIRVVIKKAKHTPGNNFPCSLVFEESNKTVNCVLSPNSLKAIVKKKATKNQQAYQSNLNLMLFKLVLPKV